MTARELPGLRVDLAARVLDIKRRCAAGEAIAREDVLFLVELIEDGCNNTKGSIGEWTKAASEARGLKTGDLSNDPDIAAALSSPKPR